MRYQITLDAGTTNIRAFLWENAKKLIAVRKSGTGVGCAAVEGNNKRVKEAVKECIDDLLTEGNITSQEVECILASGMLTSNVGLYEIPHIIAPAGIPEFADGIKKVLISEISEIPFWFIPGMKNFAEHADIENVEGMDMMRGEEVEAIALLKMLQGMSHIC